MGHWDTPNSRCSRWLNWLRIGKGGGVTMSSNREEILPPPQPFRDHPLSQVGITPVAPNIERPRRHLQCLLSSSGWSGWFESKTKKKTQTSEHFVQLPFTSIGFLWCAWCTTFPTAQERSALIHTFRMHVCTHGEHNVSPFAHLCMFVCESGSRLCTYRTFWSSVCVSVCTLMPMIPCCTLSGPWNMKTFVSMAKTVCSNVAFS